MNFQIVDLNMLIAKLDKRLSKLSRKSGGKKFKRLERLNGKPIHCYPPLGIPKWAVDAGSIQSDGVSSDVVDDGQVVEPDFPEEPTKQGEELAVESESDSDFILD